MRGDDLPQTSLLSYIDLEARVPTDHPLRVIRHIFDHAFNSLERDFAKLYATNGRPSIPPEQLLRALILQVLFSVRSERHLVEQLEYNLLFRWFVGLGIADTIWHHSTFSKNRDRLLQFDICDQLLQATLAQATQKKLLSREHFSVDGTLLEAWASQKSFRHNDDDDQLPPGKNPDSRWNGTKRSNKTHHSRTDPDSRLARKSKAAEAKLCYHGKIMIENRNGFVVAASANIAIGRAETEALKPMLDQIPRNARITVGCDKKYDQNEVCATLRERQATPHIAARLQTVLDARTTRHHGYHLSQRARKRVEEPFGWAKMYGNLHKLRHRGLRNVGQIFSLTMAVYNAVKLKNFELA